MIAADNIKFHPQKSDYRPIPFEDALTILVSIFVLLRDERKGRVSVRLDEGRKGGGRLLIQTESVY